jgi:hypothetical protein
MAEPAADPDRFDAAVEAFRKRVPMPKEDWDQLTTQQRERAFTVSRVTEGRVLQDTFDAIDRAVAEGLDLPDFVDAVGADLVEAWGGEIPGRLENIFRTNVLGAYAEGRHEIISSPTVKQARPYWRFDDAESDRECEICSECGGTILPADDPWWETHSPLMHPACECKITPLAADEVDDEDIEDDPDSLPDADDGFGAEPSSDGTNWEFDLSGMDPELRAAVEDALRDR